MATIINNPPQTNEGSGMGWLVALILLGLFIFLFFVYGIPMLRQSQIFPQIKVPDQVDININQE